MEDLRTTRLAVYVAPPAGSVLEELSAAWLGRDLHGRPAARPAVPGFSPVRLDALTAEPRRYGFHATLKPPFALPPGVGLVELNAAAEAFARIHAPVSAPPLRVAAVGDFLALRSDAPALDALAADCVRAFDAFRAPAPAEDIARRRAKGLTPRQDALLERWGYPYVLEEFRFHMTLTGPIADAVERAQLAAWLTHWLAPALAGPLVVDAIALYRQPDRASPFTLHRRLRLRLAV